MSGRLLWWFECDLCGATAEEDVTEDYHERPGADLYTLAGMRAEERGWSPARDRCPLHAKEATDG